MSDQAPRYIGWHLPTGGRKWLSKVLAPSWDEAWHRLRALRLGGVMRVCRVGVLPGPVNRRPAWGGEGRARGA